MVLLAKRGLGGAAGLVWEKEGDEGAIEVHPRLAQELLSIPGDLFYIVEKVAKSVEEAVEKVAPKKAAPKTPEVEERVGDDLSDALETASPTKRRSTKE